MTGRPLKRGDERQRWSHGTPYGYRVKRCRCDACTQANTDECRRVQRNLRAKKRQAGGLT